MEHDPACRTCRLRETAMALLSQFGQWMQDRDTLIRDAAALGIAKKEIAERTGLARTTIDRILESQE